MVNDIDLYEWQRMSQYRDRHVAPQKTSVSTFAKERNPFRDGAYHDFSYLKKSIIRFCDIDRDRPVFKASPRSKADFEIPFLFQTIHVTSIY